MLIIVPKIILIILLSSVVFLVYLFCFFCSLQRKHERLSAYNLDEEEELTHFGQSLGDMERFDDVQLSEEEVEEGVCGEGRDERRCNKVCVWISYRRHR